MSAIDTNCTTPTLPAVPPAEQGDGVTPTTETIIIIRNGVVVHFEQR